MDQTNLLKSKSLIIIPAFNEEGKIKKVIAKIPQDTACEILVIDDCSTDQTYAEAKNACATVIHHERNMGVGAAIRTGIDYALTTHYDVVAIISGDDQHDPNDLYGLFEKIAQGYDFVQGSRYLGGLNSPNIRWFRRSLTQLYAIIFRILTGFPCTDATNGGRAFRTRIFEEKKIDIWQDWLNTYELEPYLLYQAVKKGCKITEAPMKVIYHGQGTTKMKPFRDWWRILRPMVYVALRLRK
jgi:dolichol-phosphate mannosyltransferase